MIKTKRRSRHKEPVDEAFQEPVKKAKRVSSVIDLLGGAKETVSKIAKRYNHMDPMMTYAEKNVGSPLSWSKEEHENFVNLVSSHGYDFEKILLEFPRMNMLELKKR